MHVFILFSFLADIVLIYFRDYDAIYGRINFIIYQASIDLIVKSKEFIRLFYTFAYAYGVHIKISLSNQPPSREYTCERNSCFARRAGAENHELSFWMVGGRVAAVVIPAVFFCESTTPSAFTVSAVMAEPGTVLYCNLFVPALYSVHWVEVKPRSLTKTDFDSSVGEGSEIYATKARQKWIDIREYRMI